MKFSLGGKIALGFGTALLALVVISWVSYEETVGLMDSIRLAAQTRAVVDYLEDTLSLMKDAETGARGFIITGDRRYLEPFQVAMTLIPPRLEELQLLTASDAVRQKNTESIHKLVDLKLASLTNNIDARQARGFVGTARMEAGRKSMDEIRNLITETVRREKVMLGRQNAAVENRFDLMLQVILLGGVIAFIFVALASALISRDVKERLHVEDDLKKMNAVLEDAVEGISQLDVEGRCFAVNGAYARMVGCEPEELIGTDWRETVHPDDREMLQEAYQVMVKQGRVEAEARGLRKNGGGFYEHVTMVAKYDEQRFVGHCCFVRDITARKLAEAKLAESNDKLTQWVTQLEQRAHERTLLSEMGELLQTCLTSEEAYGVAAKFAGKLFPQDSGTLYMINASRHMVQAVAAWGEASDSTKVFHLDDCWGLRRGQIHQVDDPLTGIFCRHFNSPPATTCLCVPLIGQGETIGMLYLQRASLRPDSSGDVLAYPFEDKRNLAKIMAEQFTLALSNLRLREVLQAQAIRDPLTGLFNRRYMEESLQREVARAIRVNAPLAVLMLDLDHFKQFNDTFGHAAGDKILREVGAGIQSVIRGEDIGCRYGGEEFTIILPRSTPAAARDKAETLRDVVRRLQVEDSGHYLGGLTLSVGVAVFPEHGATAEIVVKAADRALYQAKADGRDRIVVSDALIASLPTDSL
jgi:diguanylate cyclase (GGDEF)-like protein/PAS domain S-box-containing protein